jgi:hypothetical protein
MNRGRLWSVCCLSSFLYFLILDPGALAQAAPAGAKTRSEIWMPALAALTGGLISGVLGPLLKDVAIQHWNECRSDDKLREQIEQSYFAPLSASAEKLIWRMSEMLVDRRTHFLLLKTHPKDFSQYKRLSTLYRVAALLGWMRAISLELSALPRGGFGANSPVLKALGKVQSTLADGHDVEERRLRSFRQACGIDVSALTNNKFGSLAARFETTVYALVDEEVRNNHRHLLSSEPLHQEFICRGLLNFLADKKLACSLDDQALRSVFPSLVGCLGYREVLIYREWQDAIGDAVIMKDEHSTARRYRIIGFEEFERLMDADTHSWTKPLKQFIEDVDFENPDPMDERPKQLLDLAKGVAEVLVAISTSSQGALVNPIALTRAQRMLTRTT